jgi:hypothetical protein
LYRMRLWHSSCSWLSEILSFSASSAVEPFTGKDTKLKRIEPDQLGRCFTDGAAPEKTLHTLDMTMCDRYLFCTEIVSAGRSWFGCTDFIQWLKASIIPDDIRQLRWLNTT